MKWLIICLTILISVGRVEAAIKIDIFNLATKQIQKQNMSAREVALLNSMRKFCGTGSFDKNVLDLTKVFTIEKALSAAEKVSISIKNGSERISKDLKLNDDLNLSVFLAIGCGKTDAFAVPYNGKYAVFFDLTTLMNQKREDAPLVFIAHEIMHGVHFSLQPEFSPENYKSAEDSLVRYMLAEGMATYTAALITETDDRIALWGGLLNEQQFGDYLNQAKVDLPRFSERIGAYLKDPRSEPNLLNDLFYVTSMDNLQKKRIGYFYGYSILKNSPSYKPTKHLQLNYQAIKTEALEYLKVR